MNLPAAVLDRGAPSDEGSAGGVPSHAAATIRALLSLPDARLDYARAKLTLDAIVDPAIDTGAVLAELEAMAGVAERIAGRAATTDRKVAAVRTLVYESGPWNDHRPFAYECRVSRPARQASVQLPNHAARQLRVDANPVSDSC